MSRFLVWALFLQTIFCLHLTNKHHRWIPVHGPYGRITPDQLLRRTLTLSPSKNYFKHNEKFTYPTSVPPTWFETKNGSSRKKYLGRLQIQQSFKRNQFLVPSLSSSLNKLPSEENECKGLDNLIGDIGIMSYVLGLVGTMNGFFTLLVGFVSQIQTFLSTYFVGVPSSMLTLNTFFGDPSAIPSWFVDAVSWFGIVDTFVNITFANNVNGLVNLFSILGAIFSFVSLYIGVASTFPTAVKYVFKELLATDLETLFANYGCP